MYTFFRCRTQIASASMLRAWSRQLPGDKLREDAMAWEYKIVYFSSEPLNDEPGYEARLHDGVRLLNELGGEGWELVQFLGHPLSDQVWKHHAVFKRPHT